MASSSFFFIFSLLFVIHSHGFSDFNTLMKLKSSLVVPGKGTGLEDWRNNHPNTHCNFTGVMCDDEFRVVSINISFVPLFGTLSPEIGKLERLEKLIIVCDNLTGVLPPEISLLTSLRFVNFSGNEFSGEFPGEAFATLSELEILDVYNNNFTGPLPKEISVLKKVKHLYLGGNYFSGEVPASYSEMESLNFLGLNGNCLSGKIPSSLSRLSSLKKLCLGYFNQFDGGIPPEFGSLTSLEYLDIASSNLSGGIPKELRQLKNLNTLFLQENNLTGDIPPELSEIETLMSIDLSLNSLTGEIPTGFSLLKNLALLDLFSNHLVGRVPPLIGDLPNLEVLQVWGNNLTFELPQNLGNNGKLKIVDFTGNHFTGTIPRNLCKSGKLKWLFLMDNALLGPIPEELGACHSLQRLRVARNQLNGTIPAGIFNLPNVELIELNENLFSGELPSEMSGKKIGTLNLSYNLISGRIPPAVVNFTNLQRLFLQNNRISGEIPPEMFGLKQLQNLDLSDNNISGQIPARIGDSSSLIVVDFSQNRLSGEIPVSVSNLKVLGTLNLSRNTLTGEIPGVVGNISTLSALDLSDNDFFGPIPSGGHFAAFNQRWFAGNPNLCWPNRNKPCPVYRKHHTSSFSSSKLIIIIITLITVILLSIVTLIIHRRKRLEDSKSWKIERFQRHDFKAGDVIDSLKEENIIGKGGAGIVYRGTLPDGTDVAIKRLVGRSGSGRNDHGFSAEIATLGRIRHRNIVRLLGYVCNRETNLLVYEYMPNGSLGEKLHGPKGAHLSWEMRYKIAGEAAKGLCYLHHDCNPRIIHRDVKSNNILLDSDYEAHVADFGLAKFLRGAGLSESMSSIAGSYGYIAPEYAYTLKVDEKSDVYSFGVVLLELIAGRKPVGEFGDGVDIVRWVISTQLEISQPSDAATVLAIIDSRINGYQLSSVINMFQIAMLCVDDDSSKRPTMREVVHMLTDRPNKHVDSVHSLL